MLNPETITVLDPACGSGHILVEAYEVLKAIYLERGYRMRDIPRLILEKNLYGLDIDERAAQLAGFALLMKARADDRRLLDNPPKLNVLALQESPKAVEGQGFRGEGLGTSDFDALLPFLSPRPSSLVPNPYNLIPILLDTFAHAKTFGSLIQIPSDLNAQLPAMDAGLQLAIQSGDLLAQEAALNLLPLVRQARILGMQFDAVVANPPYMGGKGMNPALKDYAKREFPDSKSDLFAMFIERGFEWCKSSGFNSMVTMQSWMFLSSFEAMREKLLKERTLSCMVHMGNGVMGIAFGTAATIFINKHINDYAGNFSYCDNSDLNVQNIPSHFPVQNERLKIAKPDDFKNIPGSPVAYWISQNIRETFKFGKISKYAEPAGRCKTTQDDLYVRNVWEVNSKMVNDKWKFLFKGGKSVKYYGNKDYVIDWSPEARFFYSRTGGLPHERYWGKEGLTWTFATSSETLAFRFKDQSSQYSTVSPTIVFTDSSKLFVSLCLLNSIVADKLLKILNPTLGLNIGDVLNIPIDNISQDDFKLLEKNGTELTDIAKLNWDSYETSWSFLTNPLISTQQKTLKACYLQWQTLNSQSFAKMQSIEEANNRLFIKAYGLQVELSPEVPEEQITLARADREKDSQRLISYAIGCMMGRYRLDKPGLIYAHAGNVDFNKIYNGGNRDEGRGASEMLPRPDCLAESNGVGRASVSNDQSISERGTLWIKQPDSTGGGVDTLEYRGGTCETEPCRIPEFSIHRTGFESGSGDSNADSSTFRLCNSSPDQGNNVLARRTIENAQCTENQTNLSSLNPNPFLPDADGIVPVTDELWFEDDAANRIDEFLQAAFLGVRDEGLVAREQGLEGNETLATPSPLTPNPSNLQWLAESLGQKGNETPQETIRRYIAGSFFKDHLQTYKKRPIYWLFSSGKQGAFQALVYLHRYNESTLARMRAEYVVPLTGKIQSRIEMLEKDAAAASSNAARSKLNKDIEKLKKKHVELLAYDEKLRHYADLRIQLDLDDGVKVNYGKFGDLLAEVKAVTGGTGND